MRRKQDSAIDSVVETILLFNLMKSSFLSLKNPLWISDHPTTNRIVVRGAFHDNKASAIIYEYPIWFWSHWPWVKPSKSRRRGILGTLKGRLSGGLPFLRDFRCGVYVGDVVERKRAVLDQYRSQIMQLVPDPRWQTLPDI